MKSLKFLIIHILFSQIIANINCQQYIQHVLTGSLGRFLHTATLVGTKIYFLGGTREYDYSNDYYFFYLDITKSFDKTKEELPFVNLTYEGLEIPPHFGAATSVFGELKDSIFFFGGDMGRSNDQFRLAYSFNTTQSEWKFVTVSQGAMPLRKRTMDAVTDSNNNKIYIFGGLNIEFSSPEEFYNKEMNIFDTINKIWINSENGPIGRDGHTATFLPETGEIIYIGGITNNNGQSLELIDIANLDVYNTAGNTWSKLTTKNPPEQRYGHTAVLTNDKRIIIFGGTLVNINQPVKNYYAVLDIKTSKWYHGREDISTKAPFRYHTATLYNDYMFIAFGQIYSINGLRFSDDILIYKIGEYANFTEVKSFINENFVTPVTEDNFGNFGSMLLLLIIILGVFIFIIFKL